MIGFRVAPSFDSLLREWWALASAYQSRCPDTSVQSLNKVQQQRLDSVGRFCTVRQCSMQNHIGLFGYAFSSNQQRRKSKREKNNNKRTAKVVTRLRNCIWKRRHVTRYLGFSSHLLYHLFLKGGISVFPHFFLVTSHFVRVKWWPISPDLYPKIGGCERKSDRNRARKCLKTIAIEKHPERNENKATKLRP